MVLVYTSPNVLEIHLVVSVLTHEGIASHIKNEYLMEQGTFGPPPNAWPEVWVAPRDEPRVKEILARLEPHEEDGRLSLEWQGGELSVATDPGEPARCPRCDAEWEPGFAVCWKCEHAL